MKLITIIIVLNTIILCNAQSNRFYYEYTFASDSTNLMSKKQDLLVLDITSDRSIFYSNDVNKIDSLNAANNIDITKIIDPYKNLVFREVLVKQTDGKPVLYYMDGKGQNYYQVSLDEEIRWTIFPETKNYQKYIVQKATAKINNRIWEAWFTKEIPINDGPFIFKGLPGLIVSVEDKIKSHSFKLMGIKEIETKINTTVPVFESKKYNLYSKIKLNSKDFKKKLQNDDNEFITNVIPSVPSGYELNSATYRDSMGNEISEARYIENQRNIRKNILSRNNNKLINDFKQ